MPVIIPGDLPASKYLQDQNIFVINDNTAIKQDIRPLKIAILNLMPDKITTENQLIRQLSNSIIQIDITLLAVKKHQSKNTSKQHLETFYQCFNDIKNQKFDAMIITGAPIEHLDFEEVTYWDELTKIFNWTKTNVFTTLYICWAAQAALYHFYNIDKILFPQKLFGVYPQQYTSQKEMLFNGLNDYFYTPHSRSSESRQEAIKQHSNLDILAKSSETGISISASKDRSQLFFSGHFEYEATTLLTEYLRDCKVKEKIKLPQNYFINDDIKQGIKKQWFSDASVVFSNWLNYYVYQKTPYNYTKYRDG